jgi:hypothetical protein
MGIAILSATIFTGDPQNPWAEAVVTSDNRIKAVGRNEQIKSLCQADTRVLELPGCMITPGVVDAHTHFVSFGLAFGGVNLQNLPSLDACRQIIYNAVESIPPGQWVIGRGWDHHKWPDQREPTVNDLDDITPRNPAMMIRACGHSVWVNSLALSRAHIDLRSPDPDGGRIERFDGGRPNGLIRGARRLIEDHIPPPDPRELKQAALLAQQEAIKAGVTGVHSCEDLQKWDTLAEIEQEGRLKLRVYHLLPGDQIREAAERGITPGYGNERLWFGHVKLFADGSLGSGTALLHDPYCNQPSECGLAFSSAEDLQNKAWLAYQHGWDVAIHAIGDKAVTRALEAIAAARAKLPHQHHRDRIEHVQLIRPQDLALFYNQAVIASVQPVFVPTDWTAADMKWGTGRCATAYAWKTLLEAGIDLQFGSDTPVESINPLYGLHAAVTRRDLNGNPRGGWCPDQKLTLEQSLSGYTRTAAWTSRREEHLGKLAPGMWADLSVFDRDLSRLPPDEWLQAKVELTIIGGEIVYRKS